MLTRTGTAIVAWMGLMLLPCALDARAQEAPPRPEPTLRERPSIDVSRLPLNLDRIRRGLRETDVREAREGLNLRYVVDVYAQAPPLDLFTADDNLVNGPLPYGAPTHQEILEHITPREYRAPAADFSALLRWLSEKAKK